MYFQIADELILIGCNKLVHSFFPSVAFYYRKLTLQIVAPQICVEENLCAESVLVLFARPRKTGIFVAVAALGVRVGSLAHSLTTRVNTLTRDNYPPPR